MEKLQPSLVKSLTTLKIAIVNDIAFEMSPFIVVYLYIYKKPDIARLIIGILIRFGGGFMKLDENIVSLFQLSLYPPDILTYVTTSAPFFKSVRVTYYKPPLTNCCI